MQGGKGEFLKRAEKTLGEDNQRLQEYTQALEDLTEILDEEQGPCLDA